MCDKYKKFKSGDVVVCINTESTLSLDYITLDKSYTISDIGYGNDNADDDIIWIINDKGLMDYFSTHRFIRIEEYRDNVIDDILNE